MNSVVVDFETTGINTLEAEIITGYFIVFNQNLEVLETLSIKCRPRKWSYEAQEVHGITFDEAQTFPEFSTVYLKIVDLLNKHRVSYFWCHSKTDIYGKIVFYDYAILRFQMFLISDEAYHSINLIKPHSTLSLALMSNDYQFEGYSLDKVCKTLKIKLLHHDAKSDCEASFEIIKKLLPSKSMVDVRMFEQGVTNEYKRTIKKNQGKSRAIGRATFQF